MSISMIIVSGPTQQRYIFLSPWDGRVIFKPNKTHEVPIVIAKAGDREIVESHEAIANIVESIMARAGIRGNARLTDIEQAKILDDVAGHYGLARDDLVSAIMRWKNETRSKSEQGLAALYQGHFAEAESLLSASLQVDENDLERAQRQAMQDATNLGEAQFNLGKYTLAAASFLRAIQLSRNDELSNLNLASVALMESGDNRAAERYLRQAVAIAESHFDEEDDDGLLTLSLSNLAGAFANEDKLDEAEMVLKYAEDVDTIDSEDSSNIRVWKNRGRSHVLAAIARIRVKQNRLSDAEALISKALQESEQAGDANNYDYAVNLLNHGVLLDTLGRGRPGQDFSRALTIAKKSISLDDPRILAFFEKAIDWYKRSDDTATAGLLAEALHIIYAMPRDNAKRGVDILRAALIIYVPAERFEDALIACEKLLSLEDSDGSAYTTELISQARLLLILHRDEEAESLLDTHLKTNVHEKGEASEETLDGLGLLAKIQSQKGAVAQSERTYRRALSVAEIICDEAPCESKADILEGLANLCDREAELRCVDEMPNLFYAAYVIRTKTGLDNEAGLTDTSYLAGLANGRGNFEVSKRWLDISLSIATKLDDKEAVVAIREHLKDVGISLEKHEAVPK